MQKHRPNTAFNLADVIEAELRRRDGAGRAGDLAPRLRQGHSTSSSVAVRKADPVRDPVKANRARYMQAFCYYMTKRYYEAAVLDEFIARRYPSGEWSAKATEVALASLTDAYNTYTTGRPGGRSRPPGLAGQDTPPRPGPRPSRGTSPGSRSAWWRWAGGSTPSRSPRLDSVRPSSSRWIDAQAACGGAHWKRSIALRDKGDAKGADAEVAKADREAQAGDPVPQGGQRARDRPEPSSTTRATSP